ncbi:MAG: hypothetical protein KAR40_11795 [Candidatus Sabulitectum sp.]|nr:hypothetical protein [Candidatus Sabulitectum sp.]
MTSISGLKELARGIVLAQGNTFVKELLRSNHVKIGASKTAFLSNLNTAIDDGILTEDIFNKWLNEVEGWGQQHAYIYRISNAETGKQFWKDRKLVQAKTSIAGFGDKWDVSPSSAFPDRRELTGVYYDDVSFRLVWYEGNSSLVRDKTKDKPDERIGTDIYDFHAYRHRAKRIVTRFDWPVGSNYAAILLQTPWNKKEHDDIRSDVLAVVNKFIEADNIELLKMSDAIMGLDQESVNNTEAGAGFTSESTRLESGGAFVGFGTKTTSGYANTSAVREVRNAVQISKFNGETATFSVRDNPRFNISRNELIHIDLRSVSSDCSWVKIRHMCTRKDVWNILNRIAEIADNV